MPHWTLSRASSQAIQHSLRTAIAAVVALAAAELLRLPDPYWAPITTLVVLQSTLGASWAVSLRRLGGTALGAATGALACIWFGANLAVYGICILLMGLICAVLRTDNSAYRFAGIALTIVMITPQTAPAWIIGLHRFTEVSLGIVVGLLLTFIWP